MSYTVEGLDEYISSISQITEELDEEIQGEVSDFVESWSADKEEITNKDYEFLGYYLLCPK